MSQKFPQDEFANAKVAGGRHRRVRTGRHRVTEFFKLFLFSAILAGAVLGGMKLLDSGNLFGGQPTAPATIAVLDGSKLGLSSQVVTELVDKGFEYLTVPFKVVVMGQVRHMNWHRGGETLS